MSQIKYVDLHCDSVTVCCKKGENMTAFRGQVNLEKLKKAGCLAQSFALFTEGENAAKDFEKYLAFYNAEIAVHPGICPVYSFSDLQKAASSGKIGALLTVENSGFLSGDTTKFPSLKKAGVTMLSLVWNNANAFAYPNLIFEGGLPAFDKREKRGLTERGKTAIEALNACKIIFDISHLSDGGVEDALEISSAPIVATHSNCQAVCDVSRNLTDFQLKKIADGGGVVGLNFCRDFIGSGDPFEMLYEHYKHMVEVGGEDLPALGSDFDGIPPCAELDDCLKVPALLNYFYDRGVSTAALEKLASGNFTRVFKEVVG